MMRLAMPVLVTCTVLACAPRLSEYKQSSLATLGPFQLSRQLEFFHTLDQLANKLWNSPYHVKTTSHNTNTYQPCPILTFLDRDGDGKPEMFAYGVDKHECRHEWGLFFDLNRDGKADYLVFNGGMTLVSKEPLRFGWWNYHCIDSNSDGNIDVLVHTDIDLNDDQLPDEGITVWLYDTDFDGRLDRGEMLGKNIRRPLDEGNGAFILKKVYSGNAPTIPKGSEFARGFNEMLHDVNAYQ